MLFTCWFFLLLLLRHQTSTMCTMTFYATKIILYILILQKVHLHLLLYCFLSRWRVLKCFSGAVASSFCCSAANLSWLQGHSFASFKWNWGACSMLQWQYLALFFVGWLLIMCSWCLLSGNSDHATSACPCAEWCSYRADGLLWSECWVRRQHFLDLSFCELSFVFSFLF